MKMEDKRTINESGIKNNIQQPEDVNLQEMLKNWDLGGSAVIESIERNKENPKPQRIWRVNASTGETYFLKSFASDEKLKKEIKIPYVLNENGIPAALPVRTVSGMDCVEAQGIFYVLFPELTGCGITEYFEGDYLEQAEYFGRIIGMLHKGLKNCREFGDIKESDILKTVNGWALPIIKENIGMFSENTLEEILRAYQEGFPPLLPLLPRQIIHRDIHPENMFFKDGKLAGFLDFELSQVNIRIFDPCYCSTGILAGCFDDPAKREKWFGIYRAILMGYDEVAILTVEEKKSMWYVLLSIQLIFMAYLCTCNNTGMAVKNERVLIWLYQNRDRLIIA